LVGPCEKSKQIGSLVWAIDVLGRKFEKAVFGPKQPTAAKTAKI